MKFGHSILSKIIKIVAASCQILKLICTKFDFRWGSVADPAPPDSLAGFKGPTSNGMGGGQGRGRGKGKEEREGRNRGGGEWERRGEEGGGEGKEDEGGEKEGLPPLEWRSGYAPAVDA